MKTVLTLLTFLGVSFLPASSFAADNGGDDGFGGYFTAAAPDALSDNGDDFLAEQLGNIEPAAGESVFILPGEEPAIENGRLLAPETPLVPGMESQPDPVVTQP